MNRGALRQIFLLWLVWSIIVIGYTQIAHARYAPSRTDKSLMWTENETRRDSLDNKPYLLEPFMNTQVAWDSEYYLSVAVAGYEDPIMRRTDTDAGSISLSYAFFPFYPLLMRVVAVPFTVVGMTPIAAATAAGLVISLLGTLAGMIALYDIAREQAGEEGAVRTAWLMLVFPLSVFFAVVYTEGLFVGLAFSALALMRRRQFVAAAVLAALATWTRATGAVLMLPLVLGWAFTVYRAEDRRRLLWQLPVLVLPIAAYLVWRAANGVQFEAVEKDFFGNGLLWIQQSLNAWAQIFQRAADFPETAVVVLINVSVILLGIISCLWGLRYYPLLALFGLGAILIWLLGGGTGPQSGMRYILATPTLWLMLGRLTRHPTVERLWTTACVLLLAMQIFLFSWDFWVA